MSKAKTKVNYRISDSHFTDCSICFYATKITYKKRMERLNKQFTSVRKAKKSHKCSIVKDKVGMFHTCDKFEDDLPF